MISTRQKKVKIVLCFILLCFQSFSCRADWQLPADDLSVPGRNADSPRVAMNASGNAFAAWSRFDGSNYIVQTKRYSVATGTWGTTTDLSAGGRSASSPHVAMDPSGNAVAVWNRDDGSNYIVQAKIYSAATSGWELAATDLSAAGGDAFQPQVAMDLSGNAVAVWARVDASGNWIAQAKTYSIATGTWESVATGLSAVGEEVDEPQVAMDASGNAIAVWRIFNTSLGSRIQAKRYDAVNTWAVAAETISVVNASFNPQVEIDVSGNAVVVWRASGLVKANRYTGSWLGAIALGSGDKPQVAIDASGNAVAVWEDSGTIKAKRYGAATGWPGVWSGEVSLGSGGLSQVAMDALGNATAVWLVSDGSNNRVQTSRYDVATGWPVGWSSVAYLSAAGQNAYYTHVAMDASGNAVAVWDRYDGSNGRIQTSRYDAETCYTWQTTSTGISVIGENAYDPQVATDASGNAVAVWSRYDGSNYRIQTSRYNPETDTWSTPETISVAGRNAYDPQVSIDSSGESVVVWRLYDGSKYVIKSIRSELSYR